MTNDPIGGGDPLMSESSTTGATSLLADGTAAGNWVLDPEGSHAEFGVKHFWGAITVRGTLDRMSGEATIGPDGSVAGRISFDAESVNTKNKQRDKHLRSADFFHAEKHPQAVLTITSAHPAGSADLECEGTFEAAAGELHRAHPGGDRSGRRAHRRTRGRPRRVRHDLEPDAHCVDGGTRHRESAVRARMNAAPDDRRGRHLERELPSWSSRSVASFVPSNPVRLLVLAHGYPWPDGSRSDDDLIGYAQAAVERWAAFAERHRAIVVAPVF